MQIEYRFEDLEPYKITWVLNELFISCVSIVVLEPYKTMEQILGQIDINKG